MKKVKGKKRFFLITCLMLLCAVAGIGGVLAYFTDSEQTNNKLKVAVNDTSIEEVFPDPSFKPRSVVKKEVRVTNNGSDTYVRMQVLFSDNDMQQYCTVNWNTTDWELKSDGYYYYKKILPKGSKTTPLFTTVTVSKNAPEDEMKDFDIIVREESLQVGYFKSADEAWSAYKKNK